MNYIGLNIKKIRELWGLSQEEFGSLINASRGMIMTYEVRGSQPRADKVSAISELTGIDRIKLLSEELKDDDIRPITPGFRKSIKKGKLDSNNTLGGDLQLKINSAVGIFALIFNNRIARQIQYILQPGLVEPKHVGQPLSEPKPVAQQLSEVVDAIDRFSFRKGSAITESLRRKFRLAYLYATSARRNWEELKLLHERLQLQRPDKELKDKIEKCEDDIKHSMYELIKIILPDSEISELFRLRPEFLLKDEIDFFYVFDRLAIKEKDAISQINSSSDKDVVTVTFIGDMPDELDNLESHYPIPFFDTISPNLISELSSHGLINAKDNYQYQVVIIPDITDADFAIEAIGHNMTSRIKNGDILICKYIPADDTWSYVKYGQTYLAFCDDEPVICIIREGKDEDKLLFYSVNPDYSSYEIPKTRIKAICLIKSIITRSPL
jgi:transcriptional regulator with XRE-family HTH domain